MLVLSRQRDETIMICDEIEISVVDIRGDKVRLGITAPTKIAVHRKEVYEAIKQENAQAARLAGDGLDELATQIGHGPAKRSTPKPGASRLASRAPEQQAPRPAPRARGSGPSAVRVAPPGAAPSSDNPEGIKDSA